MASKRWEGFSEDDINQLKLVASDGHRCSSTGDTAKECFTEEFNGLKTEGGITKVAGERQRAKNICSNPQGYQREEIPDKTSSQTIVATPSVSSTSDNVENIKSKINPSSESCRSLTASLLMPSLLQSHTMNPQNLGAKQKLMEEKNRLRKVYLSKALEDRKKQTQEEQHRLNMIQEELQKLDQRLSCDVSIIRDQIETASLDFMEAQKRYDRAEKEFLDAKLVLYTKLERKELLTHHLCTIIEQNEMRKAQKLSELMEKLDLRDNATETTPTVSRPSSNQEMSSEIILSPTSVPSCDSLCKETSIGASPEQYVDPR